MLPKPTLYTKVLPVRHFRVGDHRVAVESAFAEHLRRVRAKTAPYSDILMVASPGMSRLDYEAGKPAWGILDEECEKIHFVSLYSWDAVSTPLNKLKALAQLIPSLWNLVKSSVCVHSGLSWSFWLPIEFISILFALMLGRSSVSVVDIDYRKSAWMSYRTGVWSLKSYLVCKCCYDAARSMQIWIAVRFCSLVLLKSRKMTADFGKNRPNVKDFLDASHSIENVIDQASLEAKLGTLQNRALPLKLVYFGRLVPYKGIDYCLRAVAKAHRAGANVTFDIIGGGEQEAALHKLASELDANGFVAFHGIRPFNQEFFRLLYSFHLLLAAPLREDTPRSALDAMAAGLPFLAFDTYYYREFSEAGTGVVVPWLDEDALADTIGSLSEDREQVANMAVKAVDFAARNTQDIWLDRRLNWIASVIQDQNL